jgi:hypothetical protein
VLIARKIASMLDNAGQMRDFLLVYVSKAKVFDKYNVDVLGNLTKVRAEKRDTLGKKQ